MECRKFEINLISASDLKNVRKYFKMKVYSAVSIAGYPQTEKRTPVDRRNKTNPAWNSILKYTIGELAVQQEGVMLAIKLFCKRKLGDRYIGEVHVSIKQLYDQVAAGGNNGNGSDAILSYPVQEGGKISVGELKFSCRFRETVIIKKPSLLRKTTHHVVNFLFQVTLLSTLGVSSTVVIPIFNGHKIIDCAV